MPNIVSSLPLVGGRLSVDFVNVTPPAVEISWERLIHFMNLTDIVSPTRGAQLLNLPQADPQAAEALLINASPPIFSLPNVHQPTLPQPPSSSLRSHPS